MHTLLADPELIEPLAQELGVAAGTSPWLSCAPLPAFAAFARQTLPDCHAIQAASVNAWADALLEPLLLALPDHQPWRLHLWPAYGVGRAGSHRCALIRAALTERLRKRRRTLLRSLEDSTSPFTPATSLVQAVLTAPDAGLVSVCAAPQPHERRALISTFTAGDIPPAIDKQAPSRAFAKVIEAELRLGERLQAGQSCVDLGASPGSWSYVALQRGARVTAVDRSPLREDLMRHPRLQFHQGDAFKFRPAKQVDWLLCDIIASPQRSIDLLFDWLETGLMRRFLVTIKFKGGDEYGLLELLKARAPARCADFRLTRLCANKNEVSAFGRAA
jgi:23S rRNA (cytidine2498-2'-O)-methyltransferase